MSVALFIIAVLFAGAYLLVKKRYRYWSDRGFVSPQTSFPFGSLKGVGIKVNECIAMDVIYKEYKEKSPVVGTFFFLQPTIMPLDPEVFKNILVKDFASFPDRGFYYNKEDDPLSAKQVDVT